MSPGRSARLQSGLMMRRRLLQREFLVGIGPNNQIRNVAFGTRPAVWHPAGDDDHVALGDSARYAAVDAFACDVGPISQIRWPWRCRFSQTTAGHQHPGAV